MLQSATEFRKNGFNDSDAATLGTIAAKFQNVADEAMSAGEAASFIISQMTAFDIGAESAEHIIDAVNEVSNSFSVSSSDISNSLGNMSAVMSQTGASFEESLGMLTAITEVTRSANRASRGLVSIGSRLNQITDESSSTGKALKEIYESLNITLFDSAGQLRSSYDIFYDLSQIWDTLDKNTQNLIASQQAGTNQFQNFAALMQNFEHAVEATDTAINSAGSAARENAAYMESLEAKTSLLKSTFEELSNIVIDSDLLKGLLDIANAFLELMKVGDGIIPKFALLTGTLTGGLTLWGTVGGKISGLSKNLLEYGKGVISATKQTKSLSAGFSLAGKTLGGFGTKILGVSSGISIALLAIEAAIALYDHFNVSLEEQIDKVNTLQNDLDSLNSEYESLASKDNLTAEEERRLSVLEAQIKANEILLDQEARKQYEMQYGTKETAKELQDRGFEGLTYRDLTDATGATAYQASVEQLKEYRQELEEIDNKIIALDSSSETYTDDVERLTEEKEELQEKTNNLTATLTDETNTLEQLASQMTGDVEPALREAMDAFLEMAATSESLSSLEDQLRAISNVEIKPKDADSMQAWLEGLTGEEFDQLADLLEIAGDKAWYLSSILGSMEGADAIAFVTEAYKEYYGIIGDATEATNKFQEALNKDYGEPARNMLQAVDYIQQSQQHGIQNVEAYNAALEMFYGTTNQKLIDSMTASGIALDNFLTYFRDGAFDAGLLFDNITALNGSFVTLEGSLEEGNLQVTINDFEGLAEALGITETGLKALLDSSGQFALFEYGSIDAETRALQTLRENLTGAADEFRNIQTVFSDGEIKVKIEESNLDSARGSLYKIQDELNAVSDLTGVELSFNFDEMSLEEVQEAANQMYSYLEFLQEYTTDAGEWDFSGITEGLENATDIEIDGSKITFKTDEAAEEFKTALLGDLEGTEMGNAISANLVDNMTFDTAALGEKGKEAINVILAGAQEGMSTSQIQLSGIFDGLVSDMGVAGDVASSLADQGTEIKNSFDKISDKKVKNLSGSIQDASKYADTLLTKAQQLRSTLSQPITMTVIGPTNLGSNPYSRHYDVNRAEGKLGNSDSFLRSQTNKQALTGEEGPEYRISRSGQVDLLGENGPEIASINRGDTILPANVTSMIRSGKLGAFANGYGGSGTASGTVYVRPGLVSLGDYSSAYTGSTTSATTSAANSVASSINKVTSASKKATTQTEDLTDAIEEQAEAFNEQNSLLEDNIYFRERQGASYQELIELNRQYQAQLHEQANQLRAQGLDDTAEEIRGLQKQWWDAEDEITSYQEQAFDDRLKESEDYIERRNELMDWGADSEIAAWKRVMTWMDDWYNQGLIDYEYYLEQRWEAEKKYRDALKADMEEEQEAYEALFSLVADKAQEEIDDLQAERDEIEAYWDSRIEALQKVNEELDDQIEKEEALDALARARQTKIMVYKDGRFQYINDLDEVSEAQANLERIERDQQFQEEVDNLEKLKQQALDAIDEQIEGWEKYKEEWASVVDDYQEKQDMLLVEQRLGIKLEGENWRERLDNLESYVEEYEELMERLSEAQYEEWYEEEEDSGFTGKIWNVTSSGDAPKAAQIGDLVVTGGGTYQIVSPGTPGASYNPSSGRWSIEYDGDLPKTSSSGAHLVSSGGTINKGKSSSSKSSSSSSSSLSSSIKNSVADTIKSTTSKVLSTLTGGKFKLASGTLSAPGGISLVGENGPELRLLGQGDGIIPADITKNLWSWGMTTPSDLMSTAAGLSVGDSGTNVAINIQEFNPNLPNVQNGEDFVNYLKGSFWTDTMQFVST